MDITTAHLDQAQKKFGLDVMNDLARKKGELENRAIAAGLSQAEADARFWKWAEDEGGILAKAALFIKQLVK